jgi:hypothetical protein
MKNDKKGKKWDERCNGIIAFSGNLFCDIRN